MKLLLELNEEVKFLKEGNDKNKDYFIQGPFLQGNIKNKNGRIYPTETLAEKVLDYQKNFIDKKRAYGELNHPPEPTINLDRVSHVITELKQNGNDFIGKAKIMTTPMGLIVRSFIDDGCVLGVSSRALGSLQEQYDGTKIVQNDLMLATAADIVHDPSAPEAFVQNLSESVDWILDESTGQWISKFMDKTFKPALKNMNGKKAEEVAANLFEAFIANIGKKR